MGEERREATELGPKKSGYRRGRKIKTPDFLFYIHTDQMNILCLQNHYDV